MKISNRDAIKAIASNLSERFPIRTDDAYKVLVNMLRYLVIAIEYSAVNGQDAFLVMEKALQDIATQLNERIEASGKQKSL